MTDFVCVELAPIPTSRFTARTARALLPKVCRDPYPEQREHQLITDSK